MGEDNRNLDFFILSPEVGAFFMEKFMQIALQLAAKYKGQTSPNPAVGAVVVKNNQIVAQTAHQKAGEMHAEALALQKAGGKAAGADLYVTLEPCCHYGKTPPCTKAIIAAGIKRVFVAMPDPNPLVNGKGIAELRQHNIEVKVGLAKAAAEKLNEDFCFFQIQKRPFVTMKAAISLDGKIATFTHDSKWISNQQSREYVHQLRKQNDAILLGKNTFLQDNPRLNVRYVPTRKQPHKILLCPNPQKYIPKILVSNLYSTLQNNKIFIVHDKKHSSKLSKYDKIEFVPVSYQNGRLNLPEALQKISHISSIQSILLEGGSQVYTSFYQAGLIEKLQLFIAPFFIGNRGVPLFTDLTYPSISQIPKLIDTQITKIDSDVLFSGYFKGGR
jgi:diaminohydroxyphosphoribosylaminopyrimidine deaminase/5-amino-6-(5-phosphoribosylamino)uracil reductase